MTLTLERTHSTVLHEISKAQGLTAAVTGFRKARLLGNEHVKKIYHDGRETYTINGVEQPVRGYIPDAPPTLLRNTGGAGIRLGLEYGSI
ncbi:hypothetical protein Clacol_005313 [Clathrus columnatus]|uniref:Uncharacterized protein n=1 Tax=Clathrus columnatus TaxID=1419009 RepID=A0AAV5ABX1_9AGAM|nr:hypothetical protein Clacol_005313 [Clathrus columnatus]